VAIEPFRLLNTHFATVMRDLRFPGGPRGLR
jgi:hypothetical protein